MFPSACSLRSTQCAALIALATAAGISRFEAPTETSGAEHSGTQADAQSTHASSTPSTYFRFVQAFAPWLKALGFTRATETHASAHAATTAPAGSEIAAIPAPLPAPPVALTLPAPSVTHGATTPTLGLSARQHSFPFAVGPPAFRATLHRPVAGMSVPCDSATRSVAVPALSRIARLESLSVARLARPESAGAQVARPLFRQVAASDRAAPFSAGTPAVALASNAVAVVTATPTGLSPVL